MTTERIEQTLKDYWFVIVTVMALAVGWGVSTAQLSSIAETNKTILTKIDLLSDGVTSMKTASTYNEREIADLRDRVWKLEAKR